VRRRIALGVVGAVAAALVAAAGGAAGTGVTGTVDGMVELSLKRTAPDRVEATVTATVAPTRLSADGRELHTYDKPITGARAAARARGTTELTITYGPQSP